MRSGKLKGQILFGMKYLWQWYSLLKYSNFSIISEEIPLYQEDFQCAAIMILTPRWIAVAISILLWLWKGEESFFQTWHEKLLKGNGWFRIEMQTSRWNCEQIKLHTKVLSWKISPREKSQQNLKWEKKFQFWFNHPHGLWHIKNDTLPILLRQLEQQGKKKRLSRLLWGSQSQREFPRVLGRSSSSFPSADNMRPMKPHTMEWLPFCHSGFSVWARVLPILRYTHCELKSQTQRIYHP